MSEMFRFGVTDELIRQQLNLCTNQICRDIFKQKNFFAQQQINSYDDFLISDLGIKSIIQDMFRISNTVLIEPTQITLQNGKKQIIKSIGIDVQFSNVQIDQQQNVKEQIDLFSQEGVKKTQISIQDTQIPTEARLFGKSLKIDILADITVQLSSYSEGYLEGEQIEKRIETLRNQIVAQLPLMVGSKFCILSSLSREQRSLLQEDVLDMGGFFILRGSEWTVDLTESIKFNELQLWYTPKKKLLKGFVISKGGDAYQSSFQVTLEYKYKEGQLVATLEYERIQFVSIPFFLIFKIFGITNEVEMTEMIIQDDINSQDKASLQLQQYIQTAVDNEYEMFEDAQQLQTTDQVLQKMADVLNSDYVKKKKPDLSILNYTPQRVRDTFMIYFLPHMGTTSFENDIKMRYFADIIRKMLLSYKSGIYPDQHTYLEKRIHTTGHNMAKLFKKSFNHQVIAQLRLKLIKELQKSRNVHSIEIQSMIQSLLSNNIQNKVLQKSITTGSGADIQKGGKQVLKGRIQSQRLIRKNIINSIATMRIINNQKQSLDKQSKKIIEQRSVQPSFAGYVCVIQSSDNGDKAGKVKSLASLSMVTTAQSSEETIQTIWKILKDYIYEIGVFHSRDIKKYGLSKVFTNGYWVGFIETSHIQIAANILRQYRKDNYQDWKYITVYVNDSLELHIYSDFGRILTPMIIVHYDEKGQPYVNINKENIDYILSGQADINWYLEQQILEYISVEESHNCLVAESPTMFLYKNQPNIRSNIQTRYDFTHIFIPQSLLGIVALLSPFANHAQTKRITMFTNQAKQGCGWAMYNYPFRSDKGMIIQQYVSSPLVRTIIHDFFPPNGQQIIVAYTIYDGFNQEDSVIINKGSIDNGLYNAVYYTFEETQVKYNEFVPSITNTQPPNQYGNFMKLQNGIIQKGVWINKDDVLVAKREWVRGSSEAVNTSLLYKGEERAYVEDILDFQDEQSNRTIRVKLKIIRNIKQGDKLSSGQGCKAIVSKILLPSQMPFTEDGLVPDLIFNPHSIPTRMMIGQLLEATFQRICIEMCDTFDATAFADVSNELAEELMKQFEIEDHGYQYLYNGDTGERMKSKIFICPTFYYRLQKFVIASKYVVNQGATDVLTRQAVNNRKIAGGLRLGEMEADSLYSSQTSSILREKFFDCSDGYQLYVCKTCGNRAEFNPSQQYQTYNCSVCAENTNIIQVDSTWSTNLLITSLNAMNIGLTMQFALPEIEKQLF